MSGKSEKTSTKAAWADPKLKKLGTFEKMTLQSKKFGPSDGLDLNGIPIQNISQ